MGDQVCWINGPIFQVVVAKGSVWCVQMQNRNGETLYSKDEAGERVHELSYPYPGSKTKTLSVGRFLAKHHKALLYLRDPRAGNVLQANYRSA